MTVTEPAKFRALVARCKRTAWWCQGASSLLLPPASGLLGASTYAVAAEPDHLPPTWLTVATIAAVAAGAGAAIGEIAVSNYPRWLARRQLRRALAEQTGSRR